MKFSYLAGRAKAGRASLGGSVIRYRPIIAVRVSGPTGHWILDGLLDSGSDDTIFPEWVAAVIGVELAVADEQNNKLAGRGKPIRCRYQRITLRITDGLKETYEWDAVVGFVAVPLKCPLLGQAGFLQYFDLTLHGADHVSGLIPNHSYTGKRV